MKTRTPSDVAVCRRKSPAVGEKVRLCHSLMCIVRTVKSTALVREIKAAGWVLARARGSHHVFKHPGRPGHVVVPHPKKDLGVSLVAAIRKQAGL